MAGTLLRQVQIIGPTSGPANVEDYGGIVGLRVTPGYHRLNWIHLDAQDISADTAFMLVDLSDTGNWPHTGTAHLHIDFIHITINPDSSFTGDIKLGFLSNVDAANGDLNILHSWHMEQERTTLVDVLPLEFAQVHCRTSEWFGPTDANVGLFQTDENLQGPDGATAYPSGDGDLVLRIERTAGNIDLGVNVGYTTHS